MTCPKTVPFFQCRKGLLVALLCLIIVAPQQKAHAGKTPYIVTVAVITVLASASYLINYRNQPLEPGARFPEGLKMMPDITYRFDQTKSGGGNEVALTPIITYGQYVYPEATDKKPMDFVGRAVCSPVKNTKNATISMDEIHTQCLQWFESHAMRFPHEMVGAKVDQLNALLLPKLVYNVDSKKLSLLATSVNYVKSDNSPVYIQSAFTQKQNKEWVMLSPEFPELDHLPQHEKDQFQLCHHAPEWARMQHPKTSRDHLNYYDFPKDGISHLHKTGLEFIITTHSSWLSGRKAYYWQIDAPWPIYLKKASFSTQKYIDPSQPL